MSKAWYEIGIIPSKFTSQYKKPFRKSKWFFVYERKIRSIFNWSNYRFLYSIYLYLFKRLNFKSKIKLANIIDPQYGIVHIFHNIEYYSLLLHILAQFIQFYMKYFDIPPIFLSETNLFSICQLLILSCSV